MRYNLLSLGVLTAAVCASCEQNEKKEAQSAIEREAPRFNPENIKTYKGKIEYVFTMTEPHGQDKHVGILLLTEQGEIPVELGPVSFVLGGPVNLSPGMDVEVKGAQHQVDGRTYIIARELKAEGYKLVLREKDGTPRWTGWIKN